METKEIYVQSALTEKQYRDYMWFHVTGRNRDWLLHLFGAALVVAFAAANFHTGSPILGWIFLTLGVYLLLSRYIRFFVSVDRIVKQFGLSAEPKAFYSVRFTDKGLAVRNDREFAQYSWEQVKKLWFRPRRRIAYVYLTEQNAFLLPYECFVSGAPEELRQLAAARLGPGKLAEK